MSLFQRELTARATLTAAAELLDAGLISATQFEAFQARLLDDLQPTVLGLNPPVLLDNSGGLSDV